MPLVATTVAFALRKVINQSFFYDLLRAVSENIGSWNRAQVLISFSVPQPCHSSCVADLRDECNPPRIFH